MPLMHGIEILLPVLARYTAMDCEGGLVAPTGSSTGIATDTNWIVTGREKLFLRLSIEEVARKDYRYMCA